MPEEDTRIEASIRRAARRRGEAADKPAPAGKPAAADKPGAADTAAEVGLPGLIGRLEREGPVGGKPGHLELCRRIRKNGRYLRGRARKRCKNVETFFTSLVK